ncbi:uncharacterized protein LOC120666294 [Panicum virgatum]|uniref:Uncharacterized protein n=1 Tax=Panicum virgatum TaxID=38727 RepID=A0A8T0UGD1_PANVG|nr:uncharacterized protein LOC120666294 [Panicum virgatum]KAG2621045.1 hypothetical protein PVAP13_3NG226900 [Panicum virgatum]
MGSAGKIVRTALHAFFRHYHPASSAASLLALPFSAAALLSRSHPALLAPSHFLSRRLRRVLVAAGFPPASQLLFLLSHRLSQRACTFLAALPFSLSFLLLAKACAVHCCSTPPPLQRCRRKRPSDAVVQVVQASYPAMVQTQIVNCLALLLAIAGVFAALLAAFNASEALHLLVAPSGSGSVSDGGGGGRAVLALSAAGVIVYSVVLANASVVCNLATVVAAAEGRGGAHAMLKALLMLLHAGDAATAVAASLPASLAAAAIEALFQLRVMRPYTLTGKVTPGMLCEGLLVAYIHAMICVLDTVITSMVYQTCKASHSCHLLELELDGKEDLRV